MLTHGSLFSGVGGFDLGFEAAGFHTAFQVEWDKNCQQVLGYHWPTVPRWFDVSDVSGAELPPVDVISYGFPCQDLSVAGKRAGLDGNRSHLFFEAVRIITEMREATDGRYPTWAVAENVAGLLNADGGSAMGRVVDELAEAGSLVIEWATLDAQWFGVPQRRRRVFVAACFDPATAGRCPDPLFSVSSSSSRDTQTSEKARQNVAEDVAAGVGKDCPADTDGMTLVPFTKSSFGGYTEGFGTLLATDCKRAEQHVVAAIPVQDGREIEKHQNGLGIGKAGDPSYTLDAVGGQAVAQPIGFSHTQGMDCQPSVDNFPTLRSQGGGQAVAQPDLAV